MNNQVWVNYRGVPETNERVQPSKRVISSSRVQKEAQELSDVQIDQLNHLKDQNQPKSLTFHGVKVYNPTNKEFDPSLKEARGFIHHLVETIYTDKIQPTVETIQKNIGMVNNILTSFTKTFKSKYGNELQAKLEEEFDKIPPQDLANLLELFKNDTVDPNTLKPFEKIIHEWINKNLYKEISLKDFFLSQQQENESLEEFRTTWFTFAKAQANQIFNQQLETLDQSLKDKGNFERLIKENILQIADSLSGRVSELLQNLSNSGEYKKVFDHILTRLAKHMEAHNDADKAANEYASLYDKANQYIEASKEKKTLTPREAKNLAKWIDFKKKIDDLGGIESFKEQLYIDYAIRAADPSDQNELTELSDEIVRILFKESGLISGLKGFTLLPEPFKSSLNKMQTIATLSVKDSHLGKVKSACQFIESASNKIIQQLGKGIIDRSISHLAEPTFLQDLFKNAILPNVRDAMVRSHFQEIINLKKDEASKNLSIYLKTSQNYQTLLNHCVTPSEGFAILSQLSKLSPSQLAELKTKDDPKSLLNYLSFNYTQFKTFQDFELFTKELFAKIASFKSHRDLIKYLSDGQSAEMSFNILRNFIQSNTPTGFFNYEKDITKEEVEKLTKDYITELATVCQKVSPNDADEATVKLVLDEHFKSKNKGERSPAISQLVQQTAQLFNLPDWILTVLDWSFVEKIVETNITSALAPFRETTHGVVNTTIDSLKSKFEKETLEALDQATTFYTLVSNLKEYTSELDKFKNPLVAVEKFKQFHKLFNEHPGVILHDLTEKEWQECLERLNCPIEDFKSEKEAQEFAQALILQSKNNDLFYYYEKALPLLDHFHFLLDKTPSDEIGKFILFSQEIAQIAKNIEPNKLNFSHLQLILSQYLQTNSYSRYGTEYLTKAFLLTETSQKKLGLTKPEKSYKEAVEEYFKTNTINLKEVPNIFYEKKAKATVDIEQACANIFYDKIAKAASSVPVLGKTIAQQVIGVDTKILSDGIKKIGTFFSLKARNQIILKETSRTILDAFATIDGASKTNFKITENIPKTPAIAKQKRNGWLLAARIIGNIFFGIVEIIIAIIKAINTNTFTPNSRQRYLLDHAKQIHINKGKVLEIENKFQELKENENFVKPDVNAEEIKEKEVVRESEEIAVAESPNEYNPAMQGLHQAIKAPIVEAVNQIANKHLKLENFFGVNLIDLADKAQSMTDMISEIFSQGLSDTLANAITTPENLGIRVREVINKFSPSKEFTEGLIEKLKVLQPQINQQIFSNKTASKKVLDEIVTIIRNYVTDYSSSHHKNITETVKKFLNNNVAVLFDFIFKKFNEKIEQIGDIDWRIMFDDVVTTFDHQVQAAIDTTRNREITVVQALENKTLVHSQIKGKLDIHKQDIPEAEKAKLIQELEEQRFKGMARLLIDNLMSEKGFIDVWNTLKIPQELKEYITLIKNTLSSSFGGDKFDLDDLRDFLLGIAKDGLVSVLGHVMQNIVKDMSEAYYWKKMAGESLLPKVVEVLNEIRMVQTLKADKNYSATLREAFILNDSNKDKSIAQLQEELATANFTKVKEIGKINESQLALLKVDMTEEMKTNLMNQALTEKDFKEKYIAKVLAKFVDDIAIDTKETTLKEITTIFESGKDVQEQLQNYYFQKLAKHLNLPNAKPHPLFLELINKHIDDLNGAVQLENYKAKKDGIEPSIKQAIESFYRKKTDSTEIYRDTTVHLLTLGGMNPGSITSKILSWLDPITPQFQEMRGSHHWLIKTVAEQLNNYFTSEKVGGMIDGMFSKKETVIKPQQKVVKTDKEKEMDRSSEELATQNKLKEKNIQLSIEVNNLINQQKYVGTILNTAYLGGAARFLVKKATGVNVDSRGFYDTVSNLENELFKDSLLENMFLQVFGRVLGELSKPQK